MLQKKTLEKLRTSVRLRIVIVFSMMVLITLMFPKGESIESDVKIGSIWLQDDLIASTTFEILKEPKTLESERLEAAQRVEPIFLKSPGTEKLMADSVSRYGSFLQNQISKNELKNRSFLSDPSYAVFTRLKYKSKSFLGSKIRSLNELNNLAGKFTDRVYQLGILNLSYKEIPRDSISVRDGKFERIYSKSVFLDRKGVNELLSTFLGSEAGKNGELNEAIQEYISNFITPNLIYSFQLTDAAIRNAKEKIPRNTGIVNENERIVSKHDRITPEVKSKIDSYRIAKGQETDSFDRLSQTLGKFLHILIILLPLTVYLYLFRGKIFNDNFRILLIVSILLFFSFTTFLINHINVSWPIEFFVLVPVASMLLTITFDSRIGFYGTVIVSLVVGGLKGNDYAFTLMNLVAGALAAYSVRDIKNRTQIFRSFLYILVGYVLSIIAFSLERFASFDQILLNVGFAGSNAFISPVITYGLIIFFERIFNITTDLTLMELTDFNNPLLKELAKTAPGTFNHSIAVSTIAETTAESIGANPVLARVGALYHDIGKLLDPGSFVENQLTAVNIHESISPEKSVRLIRDHVIKGIELAEKCGLPREIRDFIPMHHGTMVISFFYEKAKQLYGENNVDINEYRYTGPKPNSKETAVVMLADACESTVRTLTEADSQKIETVISNIIDNRIDDGQLDEAPLTFMDIKKIKDAFLSILVGHQHKRIRYPTQDELEIPRPDE